MVPFLYFVHLQFCFMLVIQLLIFAYYNIIQLNPVPTDWNTADSNREAALSMGGTVFTKANHTFSYSF